jgi:hypothetical protein
MRVVAMSSESTGAVVRRLKPFAVGQLTKQHFCVFCRYATKQSKQEIRKTYKFYRSLRIKPGLFRKTEGVRKTGGPWQGPGFFFFAFFRLIFF